MRWILKYVCVLLVRFLQWEYRRVTERNRRNQTNQVLNRLRLIQSILYYFKGQYEAWGYFHPDCVWTYQDEAFYRWLFPEKKFEELDLVVWHNPEAVTYYQNKIYELKKGRDTKYEVEIRSQLKKWKRWN